jgi:hypothetical protein
MKKKKKNKKKEKNKNTCLYQTMEGNNKKSQATQIAHFSRMEKLLFSTP